MMMTVIISTATIGGSVMERREVRGVEGGGVVVVVVVVAVVTYYHHHQKTGKWVINNTRAMCQADKDRNHAWPFDESL